MVLVGLPRHDRDRPSERHADQDGQHLQERLEAVAEPPPSQPRQHQLPLFVQVFGLQIDQPPLVAQEAVEFGFRPSAAALAQLHGERDGRIDRLGGVVGLGAALRLRHFGHNAVPPPPSWGATGRQRQRVIAPARPRELTAPPTVVAGRRSGS